MGLHGAVRKDTDHPAGLPALAYSGVPYDEEIVLVYSEIDSRQHADPFGLAVIDPFHRKDYQPDYFLINGEPYTGAGSQDYPVTTGKNVLIRFVSAALRTHVPTLPDDNLTVVAENGRKYPFAKTQYSVVLHSLKTVDAVFENGTAGTYPIYDSKMGLTNAGASPGGMYGFLVATPAP